MRNTVKLLFFLLIVFSCGEKNLVSPKNYKNTILVDTSDTIQVKNFENERNALLNELPTLNRGDRYTLKIFEVSNQLEPRPSLEFEYPKKGGVSEDLGEYGLQNANDSLKENVKKELLNFKIANKSSSDKSQIFYNVDEILKTEKPEIFYMFTDLIENNRKISFYKIDPSLKSSEILKDLYSYYKISDTVSHFSNTKIVVFSKFTDNNQDRILQTRKFFQDYFNKLKVKYEFK